MGLIVSVRHLCILGMVDAWTHPHSALVAHSAVLPRGVGLQSAWGWKSDSNLGVCPMRCFQKTPHRLRARARWGVHWVSLA